MSSSTYDPPADWPCDDMPDELRTVPSELDESEAWDCWDVWPDGLPYAQDIPPAGLTGPAGVTGPARHAGPAGPAERGDPADPAVAACAQIAAGLDALAGLPLELVGSGSVLGVVDALMLGRSRTAGLLARYVREVDVRGLYPRQWAGNGTASYLRHRYRLRPREATRLADRAQEVVAILPALGQAMVDGTTDVEQADMIVAGIDNLPTTATPAQQENALATLIGRCGQDDPLALGRAAITIGEELTLVSEDGDPPDADAEQTAHERRHLTVRRVHGAVEGDFFAPDEHAAVIQAFLDQLAGPDDTNHGDPADPAGRDTPAPDNGASTPCSRRWRTGWPAASRPHHPRRPCWCSCRWTSWAPGWPARGCSTTRGPCPPRWPGGCAATPS